MRWEEELIFTFLKTPIRFYLMALTPHDLLTMCLFPMIETLYSSLCMAANRKPLERIKLVLHPKRTSQLSNVRSSLAFMHPL